MDTIGRHALRRASLVSLILAVSVSCTYWYAGWWLPLDRLPPPVARFLLHHWRDLDFIPALFAQALPRHGAPGFISTFAAD